MTRLQPASQQLFSRPMAAWSYFGTLLLFLVFALQTNSFKTLGLLFSNLFSGNPQNAIAINIGMLGIMQVIAAALVIMGPLILAIAVVIGYILDDISPDFDPSTWPLGVWIIIIAAEEVVARWFFLGFLTTIFTSNTMFYVLLFVGNSLWALIHLRNYPVGERRVLAVLPQFICGLFFTAIYLNFGLLAAIVLHMAHNMLLLTRRKEFDFSLGDGLSIAYSLVVGVISFALLDKPLRDMMRWFTAETSASFALPGWSFGDYLCAMLFIGSLVFIAAQLLGYDLKIDNDTGMVVRLLDGLLMGFIIYGIFAVAGVFTDSAPMQVAVTILLSFLLAPSTLSGSNTARIFFTGLPMRAIAVGVIGALGVWPGVAVLAVYSLVSWPLAFFATEE